MFTGIVEGMARVSRAENARGGLRLVLDLGPLARGTGPGDSISVAGCCLTVVAHGPEGTVFELSPETLARTRFGRLEPGQRVNIERSLRVGDRLGGHFVSGHVDGLGRVERCEEQGDFSLMTLWAPSDLGPYLIPKGSVAVDGVSLTVAEMESLESGESGESGVRFTVALIPETLERTTLGQGVPGGPVHLEGDLLGKFVLRQLELRGVASAPGAGTAG